MKYSLLAFAWAVAAHPSLGQDSTKTHRSFFGKILHVFHKEEYGKNIIRYNPVPTVLFSEGRNAAIGYERVLKNNQSFSVNVGFFFLPTFLGERRNFTNVNRVDETGIITSLDYRFYLKKLNARPAPNGIYIGPYYSLNYHTSTAEFKYIDENGGSSIEYTATINDKLSFNNVGLEIGYQFIFWKRLTVDMIFMGPSLSFYNIDLELKSDLSSEKAQELYEKYYDSFFSKYPLVEEIYKQGGLERKGSASGIMGNFRYLVQFGYHF